MKRHWTIVFALASWLIMGALGCGTSGSDIDDPYIPDEPNGENGVLGFDWSVSAALTAAEDCDEALTWLQDSLIASMTLTVEYNRQCALDPDRCGWMGGYPEADFNTDAGAVPEYNEREPGADKETPEDYSETNTQVAGVDEADRVKTDGEFVYVLSGDALVVVKSWPADQTEEIGRIALKAYPHSFFLDKDKAIILGYANLPDVVQRVPNSTDNRSDGSDPASPEYDYHDYYYDYRPVSAVTIVNLVDRTSPKISQEFFFEGHSGDTRRIGDQVYLSLINGMLTPGITFWPEDLEWYWYWYDSSDRPSTETINTAFDNLLAKNIETIRAYTLNDMLPIYWTGNTEQKPNYEDGKQVIACEDIYAPNVYSGDGLLSLLTLNTDNGDVASSTIQGSWGTIYSSLEAVYVGTTNWDYYWWWEDREEAPAITTHIHKFAFNDNNVARYSASGEVLGYAINQFAFDEYQEHLRVATTDGLSWWSNDTTESRVTVLTEKEGRLEQVGMVTGLGLGETIYAVRFIEDQGYVVTFKQIDPLYVLDLADPQDPKIAGELKIPGYSSYIHPLEPGYLLTAGRAGDDDGNVGGIKIEIFDVTDPNDPKSVQSTEIGSGWNTWSDVLWDHKAFTFFRAKNLLAIPISGWYQDNSGTNPWMGEYKSELALFRISTDAIETLPSISHMGFFDDLGGNNHCTYYNGYWQATIYRGIFIEDYVYSLSQLGLQVNDTRDLLADPVARLILQEPEDVRNYNWDNCY